MNIDTFRPLIAKVIAPFIGLAITLINKKFGFGFDDTDTQQAVASLVDLIVFSLTTGLSGVFINKKINPGNAASAHLAGEENREADALKAAGENK